MTSSPALRASIVTDEMTLLMPGAGPPPTKIARRWRVREVPLVRDAAMLVILGSLPVSGVSGSLTHRKFTYVRITLLREASLEKAPAARAPVSGVPGGPR